MASKRPNTMITAAASQQAAKRIKTTYQRDPEQSSPGAETNASKRKLPLDFDSAIEVLRRSHKESENKISALEAEVEELKRANKRMSIRQKKDAEDSATCNKQITSLKRDKSQLEKELDGMRREVSSEIRSKQGAREVVGAAKKIIEFDGSKGLRAFADAVDELREVVDGSEKKQVKIQAELEAEFEK